MNNINKLWLFLTIVSLMIVTLTLYSVIYLPGTDELTTWRFANVIIWSIATCGCAININK